MAAAALVVVGLSLALVGLVTMRLNGGIAVYRLSSAGMSPTLQKGDNIYASRIRPNELRQGQVIVFRMIDTGGDHHYEGSIFVQRIAALPGQRVSILPDRVEVDGKEFTTQCDTGPLHYRGKDSETHELVVPPGHVLTLGDNTSNSFDGRYWGCLPMDRIAQQAVRIYWPPDRAGPIR